MAGMVVALIATFAQGVVQWPVIIGGLIVGAAVGVYFGRAVKMTAMPQMVAIFNGCGGGAASLVAMGELMKTLAASNGAPLPYDFTITTDADGRDRRVEFFRLDHRVLEIARTDDRPPDHVSRPADRQRPRAAGHSLLRGDGDRHRPNVLMNFAIALGLALLLGILFVLPIGGADMPVVISLLNSFTGLAAALTGFVLNNNVLIISGRARRRVGPRCSRC